MVGCEDALYQVSFLHLTWNAKYHIPIFKHTSLINFVAEQIILRFCDNLAVDWDMKMIQVLFCSMKHLLHFDTIHVPLFQE